MAGNTYCEVLPYSLRLVNMRNLHNSNKLMEMIVNVNY